MTETPPQVMLSTDAIQARIRDLAREISSQYPADQDLHLVCILKGAFLFLGDLIRAMDRHVTIDFMAVSSYAKGTTSSGEVRMIKDLDSGLQGRNVIIVEDIVDTGLTLAYLQEILHARGPRTLRTACSVPHRSRSVLDSAESASRSNSCDTRAITPATAPAGPGAPSPAIRWVVWVPCGTPRTTPTSSVRQPASREPSRCGTSPSRTR